MNNHKSPPSDLDHEKPTWNLKNSKNQPGTMKNQSAAVKNHEN